MTVRVAVIDDWLGVASQSTDWSALQSRAQVDFFAAAFADENAAAAALEPYDIVVPMRERLHFTDTLLERLPRLKLLALTGYGLGHINTGSCAAQGILCCGSGAYTPAATAELALGLILAAQRGIVAGDTNIRQGQFQEGLSIGRRLDGAILGIAGLGKIGSRVASLGIALGMEVIAWSPHLTAERAAAAGVQAVAKKELFLRSDVISVHLAYSTATHGIIGQDEIAAMRLGGLLVNTARAQLVDETAMVDAVHAGRIRVALDVFPHEPLSLETTYRGLPNSVLSPHLGFSVEQSMETFYRECVENIISYLDGAPKRILNPTPSPG